MRLDQHLRRSPAGFYPDEWLEHPIRQTSSMPHPQKALAVSCLLETQFDEEVLSKAAQQIRKALAVRPELTIVFVTPDWEPKIKEVIETLAIDLHAGAILGASSSNVMGVGRESAGHSGISIVALHLPDVSLKRVAFSGGAKSDQSLIAENSEVDWLCLLDPTRIEAQSWIDRPIRSDGAPAIYGATISGSDPNGVFLFDENGLSRSAGLGIGFPEPYYLSGFVSPGCRPIGEPFVITHASARQLDRIGQRQALTVLEETWQSLPLEEQHLAAGHIFAGVAHTEEVDDFSAEHFLVKTITGADLDSGALRLDSSMRPGQTLQFQVRAGQSATEALREACQISSEAIFDPVCSLLFVGADRQLTYPKPDRGEAAIFSEFHKKLATAGGASLAEIAPIAGRNTRHQQSFLGVFLCSRNG